MRYALAYHCAVDLRIDELALRTGVSSRNIRAYQQRGLLPPPRLRGRTGFYSEEHLRRLVLIRDLQQRGFSLAAIQETLEAWSKGGDISDLLGFHEMLRQGWGEEPRVELTREQVVELFPEAAQREELVRRAVERGLLEPSEGGYRAPQVLIQAGADLVRAGIPVEEIFDLVETIRASAAEIAGRFIELVAERLIEAITSGLASAEEIHEVTQSVLGLHAVAIDVVRPFLAAELAAATEAALERFRQRGQPVAEAGAQGQASRGLHSRR